MVTAAKRLDEWCGGNARTGKAAELADRLGVRPQSVGHWRAGRVVPDRVRRAAIERLTGIPADAWERR